MNLSEGMAVGKKERDDGKKSQWKGWESQY